MKNNIWPRFFTLDLLKSPWKCNHSFSESFFLFDVSEHRKAVSLKAERNKRGKMCRVKFLLSSKLVLF